MADEPDKKRTKQLSDVIKKKVNNAVLEKYDKYRKDEELLTDILVAVLAFEEGIQEILDGSFAVKSEKEKLKSKRASALAFLLLRLLQEIEELEDVMRFMELDRVIQAFIPSELMDCEGLHLQGGAKLDIFASINGAQKTRNIASRLAVPPQELKEQRRLEKKIKLGRKVIDAVYGLAPPNEENLCLFELYMIKHCETSLSATDRRRERRINLLKQFMRSFLAELGTEYSPVLKKANPSTWTKGIVI